jgi:hypothetical protein
MGFVMRENINNRSVYMHLMECWCHFLGAHWNLVVSQAKKAKMQQAQLLIMLIKPYELNPTIHKSYNKLHLKQHH